MLEQLGHTCFYFSGLSDRPAERSRVVPEAFYRHPVIDAMNRTAYAGDWNATAQARAAHPEIASLYQDYFSIYVRPPQMTLQVQGLKDMFKERLYAFARDFALNILIVENALSIPLNLPLGLAITEFIAETGFPTIAHHHDFALGTPALQGQLRPGLHRRRVPAEPALHPACGDQLDRGRPIGGADRDIGDGDPERDGF